MSSWENGIFLNKLFHSLLRLWLFILSGRLFHSPRRMHVLKRAQVSHSCKVNILRILVRDFSKFFKVSRRICFKKISYKIITE